eukprot:TRINITY_DN6613_c1_g1_i1.p1 TRINITY_DN6613_c1_g1~~TRINITY_DN6613_c1_g1_i1.p1  ORF type:complete len:175 (-),score=35.84 TRINITY_DN6613_c1_g1_i1:156-680(-)
MSEEESSVQEDPFMVSFLNCMNGITDNPIAMEDFKEFLRKEYNDENLMFYTAVVDFQENYEKNGQILAKQIVNSYIKNDSEYEINVSSVCRRKILTAHKNKEYPEDIFIEAHRDVTSSLWGSHARFIENVSQTNMSAKRVHGYIICAFVMGTLSLGGSIASVLITIDPVSFEST